MEKESKFSIQMFSSEEQLYDRSAERYKESEIKDVKLDEFLSIYAALRDAMQQANRYLYNLDLIAEKKFKDHMETKQFDQMRLSLDKCAEHLQKATEKSRRMAFYLKELVDKFTNE